MKYEISKFGNGVLVGSGGNVVQNVHNNYGDRDSGDTVGVNKTEGSENELRFNVTGEMLNRAAGNDEFLVAPVIPAGFVVEAVYARVKEVFVASGTTPSVEIGTEGSEAANGFSLSEAQLEALGTYDLTSTLAGTWAAPINANTTVGVALAGTTPAVTNAGSVDIVVKLTRV